MATSRANFVALVRPPADTLGACELTHLERAPIDLAAARAEHTAYCALLEQAGFEVVALNADRAFPDGVFVEDTAVVLDEVAILCRPGARSRRGEVASVASVLEGYRPLRACPEQVGGAPASLDGGDVLVVGRRLFVGLGTRSNQAAVTWLAETLSPDGYSVQGVTVRDALHLKTAITALDDHTVILNPAWVDPERFGDVRVVTVDPAEPMAGNVLNLGAHRVMNAACPRTIEKVESAGFSVVVHDLTELAKAEAGLTCSSLLVPSVSRCGAGRGSVSRAG